MSRQVTPRTTLASLRKEAKRWLTALRANDREARARLERVLPQAPAAPGLRDIQLALAREHGVAGWTALRDRVEQPATLRHYERVADALVVAYATGERTAMELVWDYFGHRRVWAGMRRYVRLDLGKPEQLAADEPDAITLDDARFLVARRQGLGDWAALVAHAAALPQGAAIAASPVIVYAADPLGAPREATRSNAWDDVLAMLADERFGGLHAAGQMTDDLLARLGSLEHVTALDLAGSVRVTDAGIRQLARLPRLRRLDLARCGITDGGLAVLRELPQLEWLGLASTAITDAGARSLAACDQLRALDLSGTRTGDGAIRALAGKSRLRELRTGDAVTDAGLPLLHDIPAFARWLGEEARLELLELGTRPTFLVLRGGFTDPALAHLAGLEGLFALDLDDDRRVTAAGLAPLAELSHLGLLAVGATDAEMPAIAALPALVFLICQDTPAGDDGFVALARSRTLEYLWGRRCDNLGSRGFRALAELPALRSLSVSCKRVDDAALAALPRFPALRELMPIGVPDAGYRHIAACSELESLVLMYCRETTDASTEQITGLARLRRYLATYNQITDRTPQLLSTMPSLEQVTFEACAHLTTAGVATLARLPHLRELRLSGMRDVARDVVSAFPAGVRVSYAP
jgi:hypothetical protein